MSKVEVLCPNGHRVSINVTANTKIIKVLDEACLKQGFQPPLDYELRHGRKTLDLSLSIQLAALPNLAKLELIKAVKSRAESSVMVALQTSDGQRFQREFFPTVSLFDVLESFEQDDGRGGGAKLIYSRDKEMHPVLIYVSDEIVGEYALRETSLRSLGLTGGRAIIRHTFRSVSTFVLNEMREGIEREKSRQAKLAARFASMENSMENETDIKTSTSASSIIEESTAQPQLEQPMDVESAAAAHSHSERMSGLVDSEQPNVTRMEFSDQVNPQGLLHSNFDGNFAQQRSNIEWQSYQVPESTFANFKFPEETKGKDVYHNEFSDVNKQEFQPCDRESIVYSLDVPVNLEPLSDEPPEQFFEVTESDARILFRDLQKSVLSMNDQPLMTQSMRRAELEAKYERYKRVVIRIQFQDRMVLQGVFRPRETVFAIYKYVKENLENKNLDFELYTSPPKVVLFDQSSTLLEANLAPMTVVYFGTSSQADRYLSRELLDKLSSRQEAEKIVCQNMPLPTPSPSELSFPDASGPRLIGPSSQGNNISTVSGGPGVPKWFAAGKK